MVMASRFDNPPPAGRTGSAIRKRSVLIAGHRTSVSLEAAFWQALKRIATARGTTVNQLVATIDRGRVGNLSSAIRVFVLEAVATDSAGN
jgi:predicted DNA-binding ribbon-helix-helix protein